ncbi:MAG: MoaD/ThiS family protein [Desulfuromonadales bacterium]|nr:MoaD/ThiS family protein [Desulfuromonadales bacterium]
MKIDIHLFAAFRVGRFKQQQREYPDGTTLQDVIVDLGINFGIGHDEIGMVLVDGRHVLLDQLLRDGNQLSIFPLLGGG